MTLLFKNTIENEKLFPDIYGCLYNDKNVLYKTFIKYFPKKIGFLLSYMLKKYPLCMEQYKKMFSTCRIPQIKKDILKSSKNSNHIVIIYKNEFYILTVQNLLTINDELKIIKEITRMLKKIKYTS